MKLRFNVLVFAMLGAAAVSAAADEHPGMGHPQVGQPQMAGHPPAGHPASENAGQGAASAEQLPLKGKVLSFVDAGGYTYVEVRENNETVWIAAPQTELLKGIWIRYGKGSVMKDFFSKTLNRTFPSIMFVGRIDIARDQE